MESEYSVEPKSREELRDYAYSIRKKLGHENELWFPIVEFLESMPFIYEGFTYEIVKDDLFPSNKHGDTDVINKVIRIKESVYEGAVKGNGRDRMTIAHEVSHFLTLCVEGYSFERNFDNKSIDACRDPEWQAKCLAGELLIPAHIVKGMEINEVINGCGVSKEAARYQLSKN